MTRRREVQQLTQGGETDEYPRWSPGRLAIRARANVLAEGDSATGLINAAVIARSWPRPIVDE